MLKSNYEMAFNVLSQFPEGLTRAEFEGLMETDRDKRCASARLSQFVKEGLAIKSGHKSNDATSFPNSIYKPTGVPFSKRTMDARGPTRRRKRPTDAELIELRAWKVSAIKRFPELAIEPKILRAREKLARIFREDGCSAKAALVESGDLDNGDAMRVIMALMDAER